MSAASSPEEVPTCAIRIDSTCDIVVVVSDVLLRDVPDEELAELKAAAAAANQSLQGYLRGEVVHAHVVYLRRLRAIAATERRLEGRRPLSTASRRAAWDAAADELEGVGG